MMTSYNQEAEPRHLYLLGNPNVGKSTVFNSMTGMHNHTGNWSGKTVECTYGKYRYKNNEYILTDLPGTHSVFSEFSEENITGEEIGAAERGVTLIMADAVSPRRGIILALQYIAAYGRSAVLCINFCDVAKKRGIDIDLDGIKRELRIPVIGISAKNKSDIKRLKQYINDNYSSLADNSTPSLLLTPEQQFEAAAKICEKAFSTAKQNDGMQDKFDRIITSKRFGIPIMLLGLALILWITIVGANYPSQFLSHMFDAFLPMLEHILTLLDIHSFVVDVICKGIYSTLGMIISVMLPPMAIFFTLFSLAEDLGLLPRIAFDLDKSYASAGMSGKQCLTQCMGLGCNAVGVTGCRIMPEKNQRTVAMITNSLTPCNGRFALLISLSSVLCGTVFGAEHTQLLSALIVSALIVLSVFVTRICSRILTKTICKTNDEIFALELPEYRCPNILKTIVSALLHKTLGITARAVLTAAPIGVIIYLLANTYIDGETCLEYLAGIFDPFGKFIGTDGYVVLAFILALPANELALPILVMGYLGIGTMTEVGSAAALGEIFAANGQTASTIVCTMILTLFHHPCATTLITIRRETKSIKTLILSFVAPIVIGIILCVAAKYIFIFGNMFGNIMDLVI